MLRITLAFDDSKRMMNYPFKLHAIGYIASNYYPPRVNTERNLVISFLLKSESKNAFGIIEGKRVPFVFPSLSVLNSGVTHEIHIDKPWEELFFTFEPGTAEAMKKSGINLENGNRKIILPQNFEKLKDELINLLTHLNTRGTLDMLDMISYQIIAEAMLPQQDFSLSEITNPTILAIAAYLHKNYTKEIDMDVLLKRNGISQRTFYREWLKAFPVSPAKFIMELKLNFAKELLRSTTLNLCEIADNVGFSSVVDLCRNFKKHTMSTPTRYRKQFGYVRNKSS